ncbi:MAG: leucine-rich repeat domain-containing protein [Treponema sp.]|jgi:hypothetical protein|nr:leucine-rich repeat domain-containing protein [Treponema sp.]
MKMYSKFFAAAILAVLQIVSNTTAVQAQTQGTFGSGLSWAISNGTLRISGNGAMPVSLSAGAKLQPWEAVRNTITAVVIEDGVTTLGLGAFAGCSNLTSINFGKGVTNIPNSVFRGTAITSIIIPEQIVKIENGAFEGVDKLETVYYNAVNCDDVMSALTGAPFALNKCPALKTVVIGDTVQRIPEAMFEEINSLTSLTIGKNVTVIGRNAFRSCPNLTSIVIPDSVQTVYYRAFGGCAGVTSITLGSNLNDIWGSAFAGTRITELTIPENVSKIRADSFANSTRLRKVNFNATSCENVDVESPFKGCGVLENIIFGDNVRQIPAFIARGLGALESITIGSRVNAIGTSAFSDCIALEEIINKAARPVVFAGNGGRVFDKIDKSFCVLKVPSASVAAYKAANLWKDFKIEGL